MRRITEKRFFTTEAQRAQRFTEVENKFFTPKDAEYAKVFFHHRGTESRNKKGDLHPLYKNLLN